MMGATRASEKAAGNHRDDVTLRLRRYRSVIQELAAASGSEVIPLGLPKFAATSYPSPENVCGFKRVRPIVPVDISSRPFMGELCKCLILQSTGPAMEPGALRDALVVPEMRGNWLRRQFAYIMFIYNFRYRTKFRYNMDALDEILESPRMQEAVRGAARAEAVELGENEVDAEALAALFPKHESRAKSLWVKMKARFSFWVVDFCAWAMFHFFGMHWTSVQFHEGQVKALREKTENSPHPVIYLPLHKSHFDYMIFTWMLYRTGIRMPIQAAGENLNIFLFGSIINHMGGYFIRRRLDHKNGEKDVVYRQLLETYLETLLKKKYHLGFFLEGTRSRTGRPMIPKGGLLSAVVKAYQDLEEVEDVLLVPVGLSYERGVEAGYPQEILGKPKVPESFLYTIWSALQLFFRWRRCNVRMDIGEPISLRDFASQHEDFYRALTVEELAEMAELNEDKMRCARAILDGNARVMPRTYTGPFHGLDYVDEKERLFVSSLAKHVIYDAGRCCAVMSTHVLATVVLYGIPATGASFVDALKVFDWLCGMCEERNVNRDLGFRAESSVAMKEALNVWGKSVSRRRVVKNNVVAGSGMGEDAHLWIAAPSDEAALLDLSYHANNLVTSFYLDAIVATSVGALVGKEIFRSRGGRNELLNDHAHSILADKQRPVEVPKESLVDLSLGLVELLDFETVLHPPCESREAVVGRAVDRLSGEKLGILKEEVVGRKKPVPYDHSDVWGNEGGDDDDEAPAMIQVLLLPQSKERITFLQRILAPIIATYAYSIERAVAMGAGGFRFTEPQFVDSCIKHMNDCIRTRKETLKLCVNSEVLKNSLKLWLKWRFLDSSHDADSGERVFYHHDSVAGDQEALEKMAQRVFIYRL